MADQTHARVAKLQSKLTEVSDAFESIKKEAEAPQASTALQRLLAQFASELEEAKKEVGEQARPGQPADQNARELLEQKVDGLVRRVTTMREGLDITLRESFPPASRFAWGVFAGGTILFSAVAIFYFWVHWYTAPPTVAGYDQRLDLLETGITAGAKATIFDRLASMATALSEGEEPNTVQDARATIENEMQDVENDIASNLERAETALEGLPLTEERKTFYRNQYKEMKNWIQPEGTSEKTAVVGVLLREYGKQMDAEVRALPPSYFWSGGGGRYAEILFAAFFGVMAFALQNWWKYMRYPMRPFWLGWYVARIFVALVLSFTFIVILSQVNFTTPASLETQTGFGLGTAPMELVFAVAIIAGYFANRTLAAVENYADRLFRSTSARQE